MAVPRAEHRGSILVVDDEPLKRITLQIELTEAGYQVHEASEAKAALQFLDTRLIDVVVTDLKMPGMDGLAFLEHVKQRHPNVQVILMTAFATVDTAVAAMKRGAYDYLTKPFTTDVLLSKIEDLLSYRRTETSADGQGTTASSPPAAERLGRLIAASPAMRRLFEQIRGAADSDRAVLILGDRGTGKGLVVEAIHRNSRRKDGPFATCVCAGQSAEALQQELFGAANRHPSDGASPFGLLDTTAGGTLFLDGVDQMPSDAQFRLLRAIEAQQADEVSGGEAPRKDTRLIASACGDLRERVERGEFREDLHYRLNVIGLTVPTLRARREDIPLLAAEFAASCAKAEGRAAVPKISAHAMDVLTNHGWPGNVRELESVIQRAMARCQGDEIRPEHLPALGDADDGGTYAIPFADVGTGLAETVASVEKQMIESALLQSDYNQAKAAQILGIPRTTLRDKIAKYGLG